MTSTQQAQKIVQSFYNHFNNEQWAELFALVDDNIESEINYTKAKGKNQFIEHMQKSAAHYKEIVRDYILMFSEDGRFATAKINVDGRYIKTDDSKLPANNQPYHLQAINVFEIRNNKIVKAEGWFNDNDWVKQIS